MLWERAEARRRAGVLPHTPRITHKVVGGARGQCVTWPTASTAKTSRTPQGMQRSPILYPRPHQVIRRKGGPLLGRGRGWVPLGPAVGTTVRTEAPSRRPRSAPRAHSTCLLQAGPRPARCQGHAPPGSPSQPTRLLSPQSTLCSAPSHLESLWPAPSRQTLGSGRRAGRRQSNQADRTGERRRERGRWARSRGGPAGGEVGA